MDSAFARASAPARIDFAVQQAHLRMSRPVPAQMTSNDCAAVKIPRHGIASENLTAHGTGDLSQFLRCRQLTTCEREDFGGNLISSISRGQHDREQRRKIDGGLAFNRTMKSSKLLCSEFFHQIRQ